MNLEEKISGNEAAVEPELYFNELTDPSHRAQFEYLIKESKSGSWHAVSVSMPNKNKPSQLVVG